MLRFFKSPSTGRAISELASADQLTVVVGAGASMEIGLPSWPELVDGLFKRALELRGWREDGEALRGLVNEGGLLLAAQLVEVLLQDADLPTFIKSILYQYDRPETLQPGPLARAITELRVQFGNKMRLSTTNYDEILEKALRRNPRWQVVTWADTRPDAEEPEDTVRVVHLHGFLGRQELGDVVLTEGDYYNLQIRQSWQEEWMVERLTDSVCLFLGASLTDANLIRYLYRAPKTSSSSHFALFRRRPARTSQDKTLVDRWEQIERERWQRLGVTPIYADNFADVAQFIYELIYRRQAGSADAYLDLPRRLTDWFEEGGKGIMSTSRPKYQNLQPELRAYLLDIRENVRGVLETARIFLDEETLAVGLWSLHPPRSGDSQEQAFLLASSDRIMTTPSSIAPLPLYDWSPWLAIKALCAGLPVAERNEIYVSRWNFVRAIPIFRAESRIPLGAVTLASMGVMAGGVLEGLRPHVRVEIDKIVHEAAGYLFEPE